MSKMTTIKDQPPVHSTNLGVTKHCRNSLW